MKFLLVALVLTLTLVVVPLGICWIIGLCRLFPLSGLADDPIHAKALHGLGRQP